MLYQSILTLNDVLDSPCHNNTMLYSFDNAVRSYTTVQLYFMYRIPTWNYWRVEYLAIHFKNAVGEIFYLVVLNTVWKETYAYSLIGVH